MSRATATGSCSRYQTKDTAAPVVLRSSAAPRGVASMYVCGCVCVLWLVPGVVVQLSVNSSGGFYSKGIITMRRAWKSLAIFASASSDSNWLPPPPYKNHYHVCGCLFEADVRIPQETARERFHNTPKQPRAAVATAAEQEQHRIWPVFKRFGHKVQKVQHPLVWFPRTTSHACVPSCRSP